MMTTYFFDAFTQMGRHRRTGQGQRQGHRPQPIPQPVPQLLAGPRRGALATLLATWLGGLQRRRALRRQYRHLEELPDYLLRDVGLTRSDLRAARRQEPFA